MWKMFCPTDKMFDFELYKRGVTGYHDIHDNVML